MKRRLLCRQHLPPKTFLPRLHAALNREDREEFERRQRRDRLLFGVLVGVSGLALLLLLVMIYLLIRGF